MPPHWLTVVAWTSLALAFATAGAIAWDILGRGRRQALMQLGMFIGFATAYPVNVWLLRRGIKEAM